MKRVLFFILLVSITVQSVLTSDTAFVQPEVLIAFIREFNQQRNLIMTLQDQLLFYRHRLQEKDRALHSLMADLGQLQHYTLDQRRKIIELEIDIIRLQSSNLYLQELVGRMTH